MKTMTHLDLNRRLALAFGLAVPLLHTGRMILWGHPQRAVAWPINVDAYVVGALLLWGVVLVASRAAAGRLLLAAGWGFSCGIMYRSFFEQLAEPTRNAGHELCVLACKGTLFAIAIWGLLGAIWNSGPPSEERSVSRAAPG